MIGFLIIRNVYNEALSLGVSFAFCAGIMIYVSLNELLPVSREYGKPIDHIIGLTAGIIVMAISLILMYALIYFTQKLIVSQIEILRGFSSLL